MRARDDGFAAAAEPSSALSEKHCACRLIRGGLCGWEARWSQRKAQDRWTGGHKSRRSAGAQTPSCPRSAIPGQRIRAIEQPWAGQVTIPSAILGSPRRRATMSCRCASTATISATMPERCRSSANRSVRNAESGPSRPARNARCRSRVDIVASRLLTRCLCRNNCHGCGAAYPWRQAAIAGAIEVLEMELARLIHSLDAAVAVLATGAVIQRAIFVANSGRRLRR